MCKIISWTVIHGEKLGRKLWFPTANIAFTSSEVENSVFHVNIVIDEKVYEGMGTNMVFKGLFETHIFDFDADIYGKNIEVYLLKKVRRNKKFENLESLIAQIKRDKQFIAEQKLPVLTFWSFDVRHPWHEYYLSMAKRFGNHLTTIVASDENILKIKWRAPHYKQQERIQEIQNLHICDDVIAGSKDKPMQWIKKISPHAICLWYDQRGPFVEKLQSEIDSLGIDTQIIRIPAYKPKIYKSSLMKQKK